MNMISGQEAIDNNLMNKDLAVPTLLAVLLSAAVIVIMYFALDKGWELYTLGGVFGIALVYLFIKYPRLWIYSILISSFVFFHASSEGITAMDAGLAILQNVFLYCWMFWQIFVNKEKLVRNILDWFILAYFIILILNLFIALLIGTTLTEWLSEYILSTIILLYFPIRKYFTEKKDIKLLLIAFGISAVFAAIYHLYIYKEGILEKSIYIFELGGSLKVNQALYTICSAAGLLFLLNAKKLYVKVFLFLFVGLHFFSLLTTFSRTFWLLLLLMVVVLFIYMKSNRLKIIFYGLVVSAIFIISVLIVFPNNSGFVFDFFEKRFSSSGKATEDKSVKARFDEWDLVFERIERYPLGGSGLNTKIHFYSFLTKSTWHTSNIHNGYFALVHKVGIPFALFYFIPFFVFLIKSEYYARKIKDIFYKQIALVAFLTLSMLLIGSFTSNQFFYRDTIFQIMLSYAIIGILDNKKDELIPKKSRNEDDEQRKNP